MVMNFWGQANLAMILQRPSLLTESKAFVILNMTYNLQFSCNKYYVNCTRILPETTLITKWQLRRLGRTLSKTFPAIQRMETVRKLSPHWHLLALRFKRCKIEASLNSWGSFYLAIYTNKWRVFFVRAVLPSLYISAGIESAPGALSVDSWWLAFWTSRIVGGSFKVSLHGTWGKRLLKVYSVYSQNAAHLSVIFSLPVITEKGRWVWSSRTI